MNRQALTTRPGTNRRRGRGAALVLTPLLASAALAACGTPVGPAGGNGAAEDRQDADIPAFPGAMGFGARASGGRGGKVVYVTNLESSGPGSLNEALGYRLAAGMTEPRYILFKVSGVVKNGPSWDELTHYEYGRFTLAGQTSPGGVIVRGIVAGHSDNPTAKPASNFDDVIVRHLRSRPDFYEVDKAPWSADAPAGHRNEGRDDALRFQYAQKVILDHCSFGRAQDECLQIVNNRWFTVQNCIIAETLGEHYDRGGVLVKYGSAERPNTDISFHHNLVSRIGGRMPQVSMCDANLGGDLAKRRPCPNCAGYCEKAYLNLELSCNLLWDAGCGFYFDNNSGYNHYRVNLVGNYLKARDFPFSRAGAGSFPRFPGSMWRGFAGTQSEVFASGNRMSLYPVLADYELFGGTNDFHKTQRASVFPGIKLAARNDFPPVEYTAAESLPARIAATAGAFPRDPMDRRLVGYVRDGRVADLPLDRAPADDALAFDWTRPPLPPLDSDDDGMPDEWELHNGLDPLRQDHAGKLLSRRYTGREGYDNLEVYLNRLSDSLVEGVPLVLGEAHRYPLAVEASLSAARARPGERIAVRVVAPAGATKVEVSLDQLEAPFAFPSPAALLLSGAAGERVHEYRLKPDLAPGRYSILVHVVDAEGAEGFRLLNLEVD
jgi:pectate lyase